MIFPNFFPDNLVITIDNTLGSYQETKGNLAYKATYGSRTFFINGNTLAYFDKSKVYAVGGNDNGLMVFRWAYIPSLSYFNLDWAIFLETNAINN